MDSLTDILQLIRTSNVGNITFFELVKHFGSAKNALEAIPKLTTKLSSKKFQIYPKNLVEKEIEECKKLGIQIITYQDLYYPSLLLQIDSKPPVIFAKGNLSILSQLPIAVVGSRMASLNGLAITSKLVKELTQLNILIVSGMAAGIDACAHRTALSSGTVAFLGCGVNVIYPYENKSLYYDIAKQGLLLSALPAHTKPLAHYFPQRNNYIAGMSLGTLVIEAKKNSGSLITAYDAINHGREVFAVPGNLNDPNSQGCNKLIKEGAILVENVYDMIDAINMWKKNLTHLKEELAIVNTSPTIQQEFTLPTPETGKLGQEILSILSYAPTNIDTIKKHFNNTNVTLSILELELSGCIKRLPGNKIQLINNMV